MWLHGLKRGLLFLTVLVCTGELTARLDHLYSPQRGVNNVVAIRAKIADTPIYRQVSEGAFTPKPNQLRILVLGDSIIHGGGLDFSENTSNQLSNLLQQTKRYAEIAVLDLSRPGNNTLDNYRMLKRFAPKFKPNVVLLGYTLRDVLGPLDPTTGGNRQVAANDDAIDLTKIVKRDRGIYRIINPLKRHSALFQFANNDVQNYLKVRGILIPGLGSFQYAAKRAYLPQSKPWLASQKLLSEMAQISEQSGSQLVVYYYPEMNILEHESLVAQANQQIDQFFAKTNTTYINGWQTDFAGAASADNVISKYDAHPNAKAHRLVAKSILSKLNLPVLSDNQRLTTKK